MENALPKRGDRAGRRRNSTRGRLSEPAESARGFHLYRGRGSGPECRDDYARNVIFHPTGSAIYFAVDFDASEVEIESRIIPFFEGVGKGLAGSAGGTADYRVGVYGSGRVCRMIVDANLAEFAWLVQATRWGEYRATLPDSNGTSSKI
jgi:hypothetical protein